MFLGLANGSIYPRPTGAINGELNSGASQRLGAETSAKVQTANIARPANGDRTATETGRGKPALASQNNFLPYNNISG